MNSDLIRERLVVRNFDKSKGYGFANRNVDKTSQIALDAGDVFFHITVVRTLFSEEPKFGDTFVANISKTEKGWRVVSIAE